MSLIAHQRRIREAEAQRAPRPTMTSLDGCGVIPVTRMDAANIIHRYEWLGTMPAVSKAFYGLITPDLEIAGVVVFGAGPGSKSNDVCGTAYRNRTIALERGACVHWAHQHAGSFLISRACRLAYEQYGWQVFYAYADRMAGEIGTIYQACNWSYLGVGVGRGDGKSGRWFFQYRPSGKWYSTKALRARSIDIKALRHDPQWKTEWRPDKGRYVHFEGSFRERREARAALVYPVHPYPKRST